jgi:hypothetical protein
MEMAELNVLHVLVEVIKLVFIVKVLEVKKIWNHVFFAVAQVVRDVSVVVAEDIRIALRAAVMAEWNVMSATDMAK